MATNQKNITLVQISTQLSPWVIIFLFYSHICFTCLSVPAVAFALLSAPWDMSLALSQTRPADHRQATVTINVSTTWGSFSLSFRWCSNTRCSVLSRYDCKKSLESFPVCCHCSDRQKLGILALVWHIMQTKDEVICQKYKDPPYKEDMVDKMTILCPLVLEEGSQCH